MMDGGMVFQFDTETRRVLPALPYLVLPEAPVHGAPGMDPVPTTRTNAAGGEANAIGVPMAMPFALCVEGGEWWTLPYEPMVSVHGSNVVVKKQASKGGTRGTVKERWSVGDYMVSASGILVGADGGYPHDEVERLRRMFEAGELLVRCPLLESFSIGRICVEEWKFPFTKGPCNQAWSFEASGDEVYKLLLRRDELKMV